MKLTEPAVGKCATCRDQLLSVPGKTPSDERRVICPVCVTNERDEMRSLLTSTTAGVKLWNMYKRHRYLPSPEEEAKMAE